MKCVEKTHRELHDEDHRRKMNCTPLSDITMMDFFNRQIEPNNYIEGNYNQQPRQRKTNAMSFRFHNETFHRQNLLQKFQVAIEFSSEFRQSSTGESSSHAIVQDVALHQSTTPQIENIVRDSPPDQNEDMEHDSIAQDWEIEQPMHPR
ncbi:hypothetical protein DEO72_LG2g2357 [Vigna unguiculata]|uniref:Uncharacterized protein n=1 Tax=Vigna unguiculata TaxID=3917 RepID=A0A4D6L107_VIGUN|nr:hypothetical protein DEO72_LG2g2357 [Vigna unguiculata]